MSDVAHYLSAFCVPGERVNRKTTTFGLFDSNGFVTKNSGIRTSSWITQPPEKIEEPESALQVFGPAMFAGSVDKQFGFVLLNSLGRLWALDAMPAETAIVFSEKPIKQRVTYSFVSQVLRSLGIRNPIIVVNTNTKFEELYVPREIFGENTGGRGTPDFYNWIDEKWQCKAVPNENRKLYVTRSSLGPMAGRYACEEHLERILKNEGYKIYAPEQHTLLQQIQTFLSAERLIFAEGSALHLFSLVRQPHQISAVIQRRQTLPNVMLNQMEDRKGAATLAINAIRKISHPPLRGDHLARSELDFSILKNELKNAGLILGESWSFPSLDEHRKSIRAGLAPSDVLMSYDEHKLWKKERRR